MKFGVRTTGRKLSLSPSSLNGVPTKVITEVNQSESTHVTIISLYFGAFKSFVATSGLTLVGMIEPLSGPLHDGPGASWDQE